MTYNIDFNLSTSRQIEAELCKRLSGIRLSRNISQEQLAEQSGVSVRTIRRLESGRGVTLDTFIRTMIALGIQENLELLLPDPSVRPIERISRRGSERKRARPSSKRLLPKPSWKWGDEK